MGIFDKLFGNSSEAKDTKTIPWQALTSVNELDVIAENSKTKTQIIFKHSTRCGISRMVMNQFVAAFDLETNVDLHYLDLLSYREVSNEIARKFEVMHQSPQLLVIRNGVAVANASHSEIDALDLDKFV